jgi:hypothetical protein
MSAVGNVTDILACPPYVSIDVPLPLLGRADEVIE